jgi:hypothetical protein
MMMIYPAEAAVAAAAVLTARLTAVAMQHGGPLLAASLQLWQLWWGQQQCWLLLPSN